MHDGQGRRPPFMTSSFFDLLVFKVKRKIALFLVSLIPNKSYNPDGPNTIVLTVDITNANGMEISTYFRSEKCQKISTKNDLTKSRLHQCANIYYIS